MTKPTISDTLLRVPNDVKHRFGTIGFATFHKFTGPVLILSPFSTCLVPGTQPVRNAIIKKVRDNWFTMFQNWHESGGELTNLVYWYGHSLDSVHAFSYQKTSSIMSYEDGMKKLEMKLLTLQHKESGGKKMTQQETMLLNGITEMEFDREKHPDHRTGYLPLPDDGTINDTAVVSKVTAKAKVTATRNQKNNRKKAAATNNNNTRTNDVYVDANTDTDRADRIEVHQSLVSNHASSRRHQPTTRTPYQINSVCFGTKKPAQDEHTDDNEDTIRTSDAKKDESSSISVSNAITVYTSKCSSKSAVALPQKLPNVNHNDVVSDFDTIWNKHLLEGWDGPLYVNGRYVYHAVNGYAFDSKETLCRYLTETYGWQDPNPPPSSASIIDENKRTKKRNDTTSAQLVGMAASSRTTGSGVGDNRSDDALPKHSAKKAKIDDCNQWRSSTRTISSYTNVSTIKQEDDDNSTAVSGIHSGENNNADTLPKKSIESEKMDNNCDDDIMNDGLVVDLPTPFQVSQELLRLASERYSCNEVLSALRKIDQWTGMYDANFLKSFHMYSGILRVLDFLKVMMTDHNYKLKIRTDCIEEVTNIIVEISYPGDDGRNIELVKKILLTVIDHEYDGIATLIRASEDCTGRNEIIQMSALESVWRAIANISKIVYNEMTNEQVMALLMAGIAIISERERIVNDDTIVSVFMSFSSIIKNQYVSKAQFEETKLLSKCIDVLKTKNNDGWNCKCERTTVESIRFFDHSRCYKLFDEDSDYVSVLPFLVFGMKTYLKNKRIRSTVLDFIQGACDNMRNKKLIENPAMEGLYAIFARDNIDEEEKNRIRILIGIIVNTVEPRLQPTCAE